MNVKQVVASIATGAVALGGTIIGVDKMNDVKVGKQKFDNVEEYKVARDRVFLNIENRTDIDKEGKKFINFEGETIDFKEFSEIYEFLDYEMKRCELKIKTHKFFDAFEDAKKNCKK